MSKIRKAIIPVAGFGTRFLPATKAQPKEMLPVVDKPTIQYIVEACAEAGITEIIFVTSGNKRAVEDHFDRSPELEKWVEKSTNPQLLKELRSIPRLANFVYIRQKGGYGNGTPVLNAEQLIGNEPFAVFWGDEFFIPQTKGGKSWIKQMIEVYEKYQNPVLSVIEVSKEDTKRYGIIDGQRVEKNVYKVKDFTEKPGPAKAKSNLALVGGYILTPEIFTILKKTKPGQGGELWLADAISVLLKKRPFYAKKIEGKLYDAGTILGWLKANVELALDHPKLNGEFKKYLKNLKI
ncbi:MAG: UTP--glucose-1-phosphate uridylyltransferase GalU [Candidatus Komeilibacteria bacterium]|nr:UTP--glucose-1-phosphate uridylyltransferase GalU [Candidatus Komeilibacteria bacterium]